MATERKKAKFKRVYQNDGSWYWVEPRTNKWIRLCRVTDPEPLLVKRLAEEMEKHARPDGTGDMRPLIDEYVRLHRAAHKEKAWPSYGKYAGNGFRNANVREVKPAHVNHWLKVKYAGKLHMQRVMRAFLSGFFQWCIDTNRRDTNPCKEVKLKKPKASQVYITDADFAAIRSAMMSYTFERDGKTMTGRVNTGPMMQCFVDLCYLTAQRSTDIRLLKWSQIDREQGVIHFLPSKTEDSSGIAVDFVISPEIGAVLDRVREIDGDVKRIGDAPVIHSLDGKLYGVTALRSAWDRACERAKLADKGYTVKMIRAKALTDAERAGYDIKALQIAAAHSDTKTTEIYLKQRDVPVSDVRLRLPKSA